MFRRTDDLRIKDVRPLIPPAILLEEIPISEKASALVFDTRTTLMNILAGADPRLALIVGPCSIHDTKAALEYGERLKRLADRYAGHLVIAMLPNPPPPRYLDPCTKSAVPLTMGSSSSGISFGSSLSFPAWMTSTS